MRRAYTYCCPNLVITIVNENKHAEMKVIAKKQSSDFEIIAQHKEPLHDNNTV